MSPFYTAQRSRRARVAVAGSLLLVVAATALGAARRPLDLQSGHGLRIESAETIDARQLAVRVSTDALQQPVDLRILLPHGYESSEAPLSGPLPVPRHQRPRLRLGRRPATPSRPPRTCRSSSSCPTRASTVTAAGWFANWFNGGAGGQPMWETFHVEQVIPWVDANLRTIPERAGRAIAGLSQGGFGALSYAARHPDLFTSVASFSGGCVIDRDPQAIAISTAIIQYTTTALSGVADPDAIFGPRATQELNWQAHDPGTLVTNLRGTQIGLWTGNGKPGQLDPGAVRSRSREPIEEITFGATQLFHGYLQEAGIPHDYVYYGGGTHIFQYWARDLDGVRRPDDAAVPPSSAQATIDQLPHHRRSLAAVGLGREAGAFRAGVQPSRAGTPPGVRPHRDRPRAGADPRVLQARQPGERHRAQRRRDVAHQEVRRQERAAARRRTTERRRHARDHQRKHPVGLGRVGALRPRELLR